MKKKEIKKIIQQKNKEEALKQERILEVKGFSKKYRGRENYAVKDANFVVHKGEFHGFIGANGAGKTTTIKSIIGAYTKFSGDILIFGEHHNELSAKKRVGYIPEAAHFPKGMPLYTYLYLMANISGLSLRKAKIFANEKIEEFGLQNVRKKSPNTFSSGQKKKVLLAQSLVSDPELIIMDEPAANLDPKARGEFFRDLMKLKDQGKTIFISSHILTELDQYVDNVTILDFGKVVYNGPTEKLTRNENFEYIFDLANIKEDSKKFLAVAKEMSFTKIASHTKGSEICLKLKSKPNLFKFLDAIGKKGIKLMQYRENKYSLQDVYDKFVRFGSIDTPEEKKKRK